MKTDIQQETKKPEQETPADSEPKQAAQQESGAWSVKKVTAIRTDEKILLELREHPVMRKPMISILALLMMGLLSWFSYFILENPLVPIAVFLFFVVTNTSFFLPSRYTFTEEKIVINRIIYRHGYPWKRFHGYVMDKNGVYLSPLSNTDRFDRFRGLFLVMGPENRKLLKPILEEKIHGSHVPGSAGS